MSIKPAWMIVALTNSPRWRIMLRLRLMSANIAAQPKATTAGKNSRPIDIAPMTTNASNPPQLHQVTAPQCVDFNSLSAMTLTKPMIPNIAISIRYNPGNGQMEERYAGGLKTWKT